MNKNKTKNLIARNMKTMEVSEPFQKIMVDTKASVTRSKASVKLTQEKYSKGVSASTDKKPKVTKAKTSKTIGKISVAIVKSKDKGSDDFGTNKKRTVILDNKGIVGMQG